MTRLSFAGTPLFIVAMLFGISPAVFSGVIDFEDLSDGTFVTTQYSGVTVSNTVVLTAGISLNELDFPPFSGLNVASDFSGPVFLEFATPALSFLGYFTYSVPLTIQGFDAANNLLASATSLFSNNTLSGGVPGSNPNEIIMIAYALGFVRVVITGDLAGASFTLDDATFTLAESNEVPEPASIVLVFAGLTGLCFAAKAARRS